MSAKLVKRLLRQTNAFDELPPIVTDSHTPKKGGYDGTERSSRKEGGGGGRKSQYVGTAARGSGTTQTVADPVAEKVRTILRYDDAIMRHSDPGKRALKKRLREHRSEEKRRKKAKREDGDGGLVVRGHSRGGSAFKRVKHEPTFDKKRHARMKEMETLGEIARKLRKMKEKK